MNSTSLLNKTEVARSGKAALVSDCDLAVKAAAFNARIESEVFSGQRDARTLFAIPADLVKCARVTFPDYRKAASGVQKGNS